MSSPGDGPRPEPLNRAEQPTDRSAAASGTRLIDRLVDSFEASNRSFTNRALQLVATPILMWSGLALLALLPMPAALSRIPFLDWAIVASAALCLLHALLSWRLGAATAVFTVLLIALARIYGHDESMPLWQPALVFFALGTILSLIGRRIEGRPKSLAAIARDMLTAPAWLLVQVLRLSRIGY